MSLWDSIVSFFRPITNYISSIDFENPKNLISYDGAKMRVNYYATNAIKLLKENGYQYETMQKVIPIVTEDVHLQLLQKLIQQKEDPINILLFELSKDKEEQKWQVKALDITKDIKLASSIKTSDMYLLAELLGQQSIFIMPEFVNNSIAVEALKIMNGNPEVALKFKTQSQVDLLKASVLPDVALRFIVEEQYKALELLSEHGEFIEEVQYNDLATLAVNIIHKPQWHALKALLKRGQLADVAVQNAAEFKTITPEQIKALSLPGVTPAIAKMVVNNDYYETLKKIGAHNAELLQLFVGNNLALEALEFLGNNKAKVAILFNDPRQLELCKEGLDANSALSLISDIHFDAMNMLCNANQKEAAGIVSKFQTKEQLMMLNALLHDNVTPLKAAAFASDFKHDDDSCIASMQVQAVHLLALSHMKHNKSPDLIFDKHIELAYKIKNHADLQKLVAILTKPYGNIQMLDYLCTSKLCDIGLQAGMHPLHVNTISSLRQVEAFKILADDDANNHWYESVALTKKALYYDDSFIGKYSFLKLKIWQWFTKKAEYEFDTSWAKDADEYILCDDSSMLLVDQPYHTIGTMTEL